MESFYAGPRYAERIAGRYLKAAAIAITLLRADNARGLQEKEDKLMRYIMGLGVAVLAVAIGGGISSAQQTPSGSYQQTCRKIGVRGNVLYAECQDADRHWRSAKLADYQRCRGEIQNLNGSLQCTENGQRGYGNGRDHDRDHDGDR